MRYNDKDLPRTKVAIRGKTLIAWLPEAAPPVLWRFVAANISGGFSLRHGDGKVDLVHNDGGPHAQTIASFTSESSAERALSRLSRALLSYKAPWRKVLKVLSVILILYLVLTGLRLLGHYQAIKAAVSQMQSSGATGRATTTTSATPSVPLMLPGMAPPGSAPPSKPPTGVPLDVDKLSR